MVKKNKKKQEYGFNSSGFFSTLIFYGFGFIAIVLTWAGSGIGFGMLIIWLIILLSTHFIVPKK